MKKGGSWRVFAWVGWMTFAFTHAQAQTQTFDSLQVGATWWWGDLGQWTLAEEDSLWSLDATSEGPHVLCGCQLDVSEQSLVALQWHQGVHGSNANRSQVYFGAADGDNAVESARLWGLKALGDSLTSGVRLSAGESGSFDSLRVERPGTPPLALDGTCHDWGSPFELGGLWRPFGSHDGAFLGKSSMERGPCSPRRGPRCVSRGAHPGRVRHHRLVVLDFSRLARVRRFHSCVRRNLACERTNPRLLGHLPSQGPGQSRSLPHGQPAKPSWVEDTQPLGGRIFGRSDFA